MAIRLIVGLALTVFMFIELFYVPPSVRYVTLSILSLIAVCELLWKTKYIRSMRVMFLCCVTAAFIPLWEMLSLTAFFAYGYIFVFVFLLFLCGLSLRGKMPFERICVAFFASIIIPLFFSSITRIVDTKIIYIIDDNIGYYIEGKFVILLPIIAAFITDTFAYLIGAMFGKRKLAPNISPKKSVEGSVAGVVGTLLVTLAYCMFVSAVWEYTFNIPIVLLYATIGSLAAQFGDLFMSYIKRGCGIKDFSTLLPGHGGIMDRCDSLLFAVPAYEIMMHIGKVIDRVIA